MCYIVFLFTEHQVNETHADAETVLGQQSGTWWYICFCLQHTVVLDPVPIEHPEFPDSFSRTQSLLSIQYMPNPSVSGLQSLHTPLCIKL